MRKDHCKLTGPNTLKYFTEPAKVLAESNKPLKPTPRSGASSAAPITVRHLSIEKGTQSRSIEGSRCQGVLVIEDQKDTSIAKAPEEDYNDSTILIQDDNDSHVFSIRALPFRRHLFSKRHDDHFYLRKKQFRAKLLGCFEFFDPSHSSSDCPYKEVDRSPEFHR